MPDEALPASPDITVIRQLVQELPVPSAVLDGPMHRILYVNPAFEQAIGREAARLVGRAAAEAFPRQAVAGRVPLLDKVRGTGRPVCRSAVPLRLRPDELRYWDLEVSPLRPEHGPNPGALGALLVQLRDVTDRCRALREGEAARARLDALFAFAPEGLLIAEGRRARARRISAHGLTMAGLREGDVLGRDIRNRPLDWQIFHPDGVNLAKPEELPLARATRGELVQNSPWLMRGANGRLIPILCNAGPVRDAEGRITGGILAWRDMSELREAEAALRASEARFRSLAEAMPHGVWQTDAEGRVEYLNARWRDYAGPAAEAGFQALLHPEDAAGFAAAWAAARDGGGELDMDLRLRRADGAWRWFRLRGAPVLDAAGVARHWVGTCTDTEDRHQAEAALREALAAQQRLAREADHRIKNSLQLVAALLRLQSGRAAEPATRGALEAATARVQAVAEAHRALQNSGDLRSVRLADMLRDLAAAAGALHPGADVRIAAPDALMLDAERAIPLALILSELVTNALKHAYPLDGSGPVHLTAEAAGGRLLAVVADEGRGLPAEGSKGASTGGHSLGETVVRSLARQIGAEVRRSSPGRGLRVELDLPLQQCVEGRERGRP